MSEIEVWFYSAPFSRLIQTGDWKGILLRSHILWLGQRLTHCSIRIDIGGFNRIYMATWEGMQSYDTVDEKAIPIEKVAIGTNTNDVINRVLDMYTSSYYAKITLKNLLYMMFRQPEKVDGILCTSFILKALGEEEKPELLYPDNLFNYLSNECS